eukprot:2350141-Prymnesium_polylepis.1
MAQMTGRSFIGRWCGGEIAVTGVPSQEVSVSVRVRESLATPHSSGHSRTLRGAWEQIPPLTSA